MTDLTDLAASSSTDRLSLRIHRGSDQIGGSCVELICAGKSLLLDLGLPLDTAPETNTRSLLPTINGLTDGTGDVLAVLLTHLHQDHIGLAGYVSPNIPIGMGTKARSIVNAASHWVPGGFPIPEGIELHDGKSIEIGPFRVTPYLVDHSAFDAYALLVEAGGSRLFYSGDLRAHGRKGVLFDRLLNRLGPVDALVMEGTTLGRPGTDIGFQSERELEETFVREICSTEGAVLVYASAQNIDRVVTIYRAARRSGRKLVVDLYAAAVLEATDQDSIPKLGWEDVLLYTPFRQRVIIKNEGRFELLDRLKKVSVRRLYPEDLKDIAANSVFLFRPLLQADLERADALYGAKLIYSQWSGYLKEGRLDRMLDWIKRHNIPMVSIHTSGHASVVDLKRLVEALQPTDLIPIHTFEPNQYEKHFGKATILRDGELFEVSRERSSAT